MKKYELLDRMAELECDLATAQRGSQFYRDELKKACERRDGAETRALKAEDRIGYLLDELALCQKDLGDEKIKTADLEARLTREIDKADRDYAEQLESFNRLLERWRGLPRYDKRPYACPKCGGEHITERYVTTGTLFGNPAQVQFTCSSCGAFLGQTRPMDGEL